MRKRYRGTGKLTGPARPHRPQKPCASEGCTGWAWARGYCDPHYQKLKREGRIKATRIVGDPVARFRASYEANGETGCWEWTAWIHPNGYGVVTMGGKSKKVRAHRFSWELHNAPIPDGLFVLHRCDNRRCVNPAHLFLGTKGDNMRDCVAKGRHPAKPGATNRKITAQMALAIRVLFARGKHSMTGLAATYGVSIQTILAVLHNGQHA